MPQRNSGDGVSGAIVVFKPNGEMRMKWQFDTRNWCVFGSHKDCDIQIKSEGIAELQALVKLEAGQFWLETLNVNHQTTVPGRHPLQRGEKVQLNDGAQFFVGSRHFGAELTSASAAVHPTKNSPRNPYIAEINRSSKKKGYGASASKTKASRRTSLVLSGEQHMLVEPTTQTELFPSSVLETPSESVSSVLDRETTPTSEGSYSSLRDTARRISLSHESEEDEQDEDTTDVEETDDENEAEHSEQTLPEEEPAIFDFDRSSYEAKQTKKSSENDSWPEPSMSDRHLFTRPLHFNPIETRERVRETNESSQSLGGRFSRWPRNKRNPATQPANLAAIAADPSYPDDMQNAGASERAESSSKTLSVKSKKQMAFERLSQGLPSTPMKWETGVAGHQQSSVKAMKPSTPSSVTRREAKSAVISGKKHEDLTAERQNVEKSASAHVTDTSKMSSRPPRVIPRESNQAVSNVSERKPESASRADEPQSPTSRSARKSLLQKPSDAAQPSRRSVLFNDLELEQGPHYSPARVRVKSKLGFGTQAPFATRNHPQSSPPSKLSEAERLTKRIQGPPPNQQLQELGTFFYPVDDGAGHKGDEDTSESVGQSTEEDPSTGSDRDSSSSYTNSNISEEDSRSDGKRTPDSTLRPDENVATYEEGWSDSLYDDTSAESGYTSDPVVSSSQVDDSSSGEASGTGEDGHAEQNDESGSSHSSDETEKVDTAIPRRGSILGAMINAAKAVSERFSIGGTSSRLSGASETKELGFDPEEMETASESDAFYSSHDEQEEGEEDITPTSSSAAETGSDGNIFSSEDEHKNDEDHLSSTALDVTDVSHVHSPKTASVENNAVSRKTNDRSEVDDLQRFRDMKFVALRRHMKSLGLDTTGKKDVLIARLSEFLSIEETPMNSEEESTSPDAAVTFADVDDESVQEVELSKCMEKDSEETVKDDARKTFEGRTVKELQQFMKRNNLEIPPKIKKAELIDLVISSGIDSSGVMITTGPVEGIQGTSDLSELPGTKTTRNTHAQRNTLIPSEVEHATPIRRSARRKAAVKPMSESQQPNVIPKTEMDTVSRQKARSSLKLVEETTDGKHSTRGPSRSSAQSKAQSPSVVEAASVRRSARKRNPTSRF